jgi:hypothetical protein
MDRKSYVFGILIAIAFWLPTFLFFFSLYNSLQENFYSLSLDFINTTSNLEEKISGLEKMLAEEKERTLNLEKEILNLENETLNLKREIEDLKRDTSSKLLAYPTLEELEDFVGKEGVEISELEYDNEKFNCYDFSDLFIKRFSEKGYFSCQAILVFPNNMSHSIVAVKLRTGDVVYVEPQSAFIIYSLKEGTDYCDVVDWDCDWIILRKKSCFDNFS